MENVNLEFDQIINGISNNLKKHGVNKETKSLTSDFYNLPLVRQKHILTKSSLQLEQMELLEPSLSESDCVSRLCLYHRLEPVDKRVYERFSDDVFWEILDFEFNQIYRNKIAYKCTTYSVSQLEEHTPFELYERPKMVMGQLMEVVAKLKDSKTVVEMSHIKPYLLREAFSEQHGLIHVQHEFACALADIQTGEIRAFVTGLRPKPIPLSKLDSNILVMN